MDKRHDSYRWLRMGRRNIVDRYISKLEQFYEDNNFVTRTQNLVSKIQHATNSNTTQQLFQQFDNLDAERTRYMTAAENYVGRPNKP